MTDPIDAPGWHAIDLALVELHGDQEPVHWGTMIPWSLGGPDPLDGVSAYRVESPSHWHFVTFGLSELYEKENDDPHYSGFGFELTFRLSRDPSVDTEPPVWCVGLLQNLARYVFNSGRTLDPGDHLHLNSPIRLDDPTNICALAFADDPVLAPIETPNGACSFVQLVGLTNEEYEACLEWNTNGVLAEIRKRTPLYVCKLDRRSIADEPSFHAALRSEAETEGSSTGVLFGEQIGWSRLSDDDASAQYALAIDRVCAQRTSRILPGRILFDSAVSLISSSSSIRFEPSVTPSISVKQDDCLVLGLDSALLANLERALASGVQSFSLQPHLPVRVDVAPTIIRDREGNPAQVIE